MNATIHKRVSDMECEIGRLRKRLITQQSIVISLFVIVVAAFCIGAASQDGHFDRVFAKSVVIRNAKGETAAQLYAADGAGSLLIRDSSGEEAIHILSGPERNDLFIHDRKNGRIAVAIQGMKDSGRLSLHKTFPNLEAAKGTLGHSPDSYLINEKGKVTVPVFRLPDREK